MHGMECKKLKEVNVREGFVSLGAGGEYTAIDSIGSSETAVILNDLDGYGRSLAEGPAAALATNIKLVSVCMRALPELLAGQSPHLSSTHINASSLSALEPACEC